MAEEKNKKAIKIIREFSFKHGVERWKKHIKRNQIHGFSLFEMDDAQIEVIATLCETIMPSFTVKFKGEKIYG